jgi:hypothetical protein
MSDSTADVQATQFRPEAVNRERLLYGNQRNRGACPVLGGVRIMCANK